MEGKNVYMEDPATIAEKSVGPDGEKVVDSDEEEQQRDQKDNEWSIKYSFDDATLAGALPQDGSLVVCTLGAPQALFKIILDADLTEVGKIEVTEKKEDKTETVATLWKSNGVALLFLTSSIKSNYCVRIVDKFFGPAAQKNCVVVSMATIYKTTYQTPEGLMQIDDSKPYPMRFIKTSHKSDKIDGLLSGHSEQFQPDNAFNFTGGLPAAFLMEAEIMGKPALSLRCIVDQHVITTEIL